MSNGRHKEIEREYVCVCMYVWGRGPNVRRFDQRCIGYEALKQSYRVWLDRSSPSHPPHSWLLNDLFSSEYRTRNEWVTNRESDSGMTTITHTIPYYTIHRTIPYHATPHHMYHTIPCHTIPYHTISYHTTIPYHTNTRWQRIPHTMTTNYIHDDNNNIHDDNRKRTKAAI